MRPVFSIVGLLIGLATTCATRGDDPAPPGTSHALIVVGLPGDSEHQALFAETVGRWKDGLTGSLGFNPANVQILSGSAEKPATRESIAREVKSLREKLKPDDRVWVLVLGHANLDDGHAFLHLPGPDLRDDEFATLFSGMVAREQVFWMTTAASGAFVRPLAAPGRIVIAATERSGESNETEFPHALAVALRQPLATLDLDHNGKVSVFELFLATTRAVEARFQADKRAPTEHAQIDDDGDGVGTEPNPDRKPTDPDGALASRTWLPIRPAPAPSPPPSNRSDHGTVRAVPTPR